MMRHLLLTTALWCVTHATQMGEVGTVITGLLNSTEQPPSLLAPSSKLYLHAIGVQEKQSVPQCWAIKPDFTVGTDPAVLGTLGVSLGNTNTAGYIYFPEDYEAPLHGPGANQYVIFLTGSAIITFPSTEEIINCTPGTNLVVVDNSTVSAGHRTSWKAGTSVITVRFKDTVPPPHEVVARHFCTSLSSCIPESPKG